VPEKDSGVSKQIRIREDQDEWLEKNHINASSLIRDLLDGEIARREGKLAEATA
jgi:hypothetical protein